MNLAETRNHRPLVNKPKVKKKREKIRAVSRKMGALKRQYMLIRNKFLTDNQLCEWSMEVLGKMVPATECHHRKGRGQFLLDESTFMAVCSDAHKSIHSNTKLSYERGWMLPRR